MRQQKTQATRYNPTPEAKTILIADASASDRQIIDILLSAQNYTLHMCKDGQEVLSHLRSNNPDLIILDVDLPLLSGLELCNKLRAVTRLRDVPVIMTTAKNTASSKLREIKTVASLCKAQVLEKPLGSRGLVHRVQEILEH